jgi:hypothetical protein
VGISEADVDAFSPLFSLRERQDGFENEQRRSVWLRFERV